jgi:hypothetical protein
MSELVARPRKQVSRLLTNHWFWILAFVLSWLVMITVLIADGYGAATPH